MCSCRGKPRRQPERGRAPQRKAEVYRQRESTKPNQRPVVGATHQAPRVPGEPTHASAYGGRWNLRLCSPCATICSGYIERLETDRRLAGASRELCGDTNIYSLHMYAWQPLLGNRRLGRTYLTAINWLC